MCGLQQPGEVFVPETAGDANDCETEGDDDKILAVPVLTARFHHLVFLAASEHPHMDAVQ